MSRPSSRGPERIIVVSDLHLAVADAGGFAEGHAFASLLSHLAADAIDTELVLAGDVFDLLLDPNYTEFSAELAIPRIGRILDAHPDVVASLCEFGARSGNSIALLSGNHDPEVLLPAVREYLRGELRLAHLEGEVVLADPTEYPAVYGRAVGPRDAPIWIGHGDRWDPDNYIDRAALLSSGYMELPLGRSWWSRSCGGFGRVATSGYIGSSLSSPPWCRCCCTSIPCVLGRVFAPIRGYEQAADQPDSHAGPGDGVVRGRDDTRARRSTVAARVGRERRKRAHRQSARRSAAGAGRRPPALFRQVEDRNGEANALAARGDLRKRVARLEEAEADYDAALALYQQGENRVGEGDVLRARGSVRQYQNRLEEAEADYDAALALFRHVENPGGEANVLQSIGDLQVGREHWEAALSSYLRARELYVFVNDSLGLSNVDAELARTHAALGDTPSAIGAALEALAVGARAQNEYAIRVATTTLLEQHVDALPGELRDTLAPLTGKSKP